MSDDISKEKRPRGRPKGTVDTVERKKREDKELSVLPGENAKITFHNLTIMQQPKIDTGDRQQVEDRISWYFETCINNDIRPGVAGLCLALGISRQAWQKWGAGINRDYEDIVQRSRLVMESILEQYMLLGKINPVTGIFLLKNNFGYTDKSEVVLTPNNPMGDSTDVEALKQKYLDNVSNVYEDYNDVSESIDSTNE